MKTKTILMFFVTLLVIVSCAPKTTTLVNKDQALFDSLLKVSTDAYNSGNPKDFVDFFTDDALRMINGKSYWGKDTILVFAKSMAPFVKNLKAYLGPTTINQDLIQMQKYFTADITKGSSILQGQGLATFVWKKQADNSWKIILEIEDYSIKPF